MSSEPIYKDCPNCNTSIWPDPNGCDSLQCPGCKKYLCWVCLSIQPDSGACHTHLQSVHGGYYSRRK